MLVTFALPILVQFTPDTCFIFQNPWFLLQYFPSVFHRWMSINGHNEHARGAWTRGKEGGVTSVAQSSSQMCAQNYSGAQFIVPIRGLIPGPSTAPGPTVGWRGYLRGSFLSTTLRPRLCSAINPTMHVQYGFINFLCHESTQIREYDQVLLS